MSSFKWEINMKKAIFYWCLKIQKETQKGEVAKEDKVLLEGSRTMFKNSSPNSNKNELSLLKMQSNLS